ncbi:MAG: DEAD/DEAH box helicase [Phycisphaerae bacterium]|nr:DEAD/DEAH box helicase [Phycisphaerae bacterium]
MQFEDLRLIKPLLQAIRAKGYDTPTPIQEKAIPPLLEGKDMFGCAQTGTGKTAAFALPVLQKLYGNVAESKANHKGGRVKPFRPIRGLVLTPTRELAAQVAENFKRYGCHTGLRHTVIFGGVNQTPQVRTLRKGVDVLVATPGRLMDLMNQGIVKLKDLEVFVLDEADRMLDMGFINDIRKIVKDIPKKRQTLMFSATMPKEIRKLADTILKDPVTVQTTPIKATATAADTVAQSLYFVESTGKAQLLASHLKESHVTRAIVFTRTKHRADKVTKNLNRLEISAAAFHSNKSQNTRLRTLDSFKKGTVSVLVASDIAARGIDIDNISHVFNYDLPSEAETYVHRIGRTGRAGTTGQAISFCSSDEHKALRDIEKLLGEQIPVQKEFAVPGINPDAPLPPRLRRLNEQRSEQSKKSASAPRGDKPQRRRKSGESATTEHASKNNKFRGRRKRKPQDHEANKKTRRTTVRKGLVRKTPSK